MPLPGHADADSTANRHQSAAALGRNAAHGVISTFSGATFVLTTNSGPLTVVTSPETQYHSPHWTSEAPLTFAALRVGQRVAVKGERPSMTMLVASRVHIVRPTP